MLKLLIQALFKRTDKNLLTLLVEQCVIEFFVKMFSYLDFTPIDKLKYGAKYDNWLESLAQIQTQTKSALAWLV